MLLRELPVDEFFDAPLRPGNRSGKDMILESERRGGLLDRLDGNQRVGALRDRAVNPDATTRIVDVISAIPSEHEENCFDSRLMIDIAMVGQLMPEPVRQLI